MAEAQAIEFYGSQVELGRAIGRSKQAVNGYKEKLPRGVQFEIHVKTQGQLRVDEEYQ
jgi:hypothetical protein